MKHLLLSEMLEVSNSKCTMKNSSKFRLIHIMLMWNFFFVCVDFIIWCYDGECSQPNDANDFDPNKKFAWQCSECGRHFRAKLKQTRKQKLYTHYTHIATKMACTHTQVYTFTFVACSSHVLSHRCGELNATPKIIDAVCLCVLFAFVVAIFFVKITSVLPLQLVLLL